MPVPAEELTVTERGSGPYPLVAGPDGALWFTEHRGALRNSKYRIHDK
ncbi:hypothetical protein [Streptomyces kronopolitis]